MVSLPRNCDCFAAALLISPPAAALACCEVESVTVHQTPCPSAVLTDMEAQGLRDIDLSPQPPVHIRGGFRLDPKTDAQPTKFFLYLQQSELGIGCENAVDGREQGVEDLNPTSLAIEAKLLRDKGMVFAPKRIEI